MHPKGRCRRLYTYIRHERKHTCRGGETRSKADTYTMDYDSAAKSEEHRPRDDTVEDQAERR